MTAALALVCGATADLPDCLIPDALALETALGRAGAADVQRYLRCTLQAHHDGDHHGHVLDLDGVDTGSVWTTWSTGGAPEKVTVLPDCPSEDGKPCVEAAGHHGGHTWQTHDPVTARR